MSSGSMVDSVPHSRNSGDKKGVFHKKAPFQFLSEMIRLKMFSDVSGYSTCLPAGR
jgi:hypothetical protein